MTGSGAVAVAAVGSSLACVVHSAADAAVAAAGGGQSSTILQKDDYCSARHRSGADCYYPGQSGR